MRELDWSAPFEELREGQRFRSRARTITETDLVGFSALTGDTHPQHTDAAWAAASRFGERIAHGMLLVSYAVGLVPFDPERVLALRRIRDVVFKRPAPIGATMHIDGRISSLNRVGEGAGLVEWSWDIRDAGELLLCRAGVEVLWGTRAAAPPRHEDVPADGALDLPPGVVPC
jgi:3-hydroxybutyryl-CoA dehydratase